MKTFINVAQMKLATLQAGQFVETGGEAVKGDGGQARYLVTAGVSPDDSVSPDLANGNHALYQGVGAVNDLSQTYIFDTVAAFKASTIVFPVGKKIFWKGYYAESDGGSNWGIVTSGAHTDDGGSIFTLADGKYVEANLKGYKVSNRKFGAVGEGESSRDIDTAIHQKWINYGVANDVELRVDIGYYALTTGLIATLPDRGSLIISGVGEAAHRYREPDDMKCARFFASASGSWVDGESLLSTNKPTLWYRTTLVLDKVQFVGDNETTDSVDNGIVTGVYSQVNTDIDKCGFYLCKIGLNLNSGGNSIDKSRFSKCSWAGIRADGGDSSYSNNHFDNIRRDTDDGSSYRGSGIFLAKGNNSNISGGKVEACQKGVFLYRSQGINISTINFDSNKCHIRIQSEINGELAYVARSINITNNRFLAAIDQHIRCENLTTDVATYTMTGNSFARGNTGAYDDNQTGLLPTGAYPTNNFIHLRGTGSHDTVMTGNNTLIASETLSIYHPSSGTLNLTANSDAFMTVDLATGGGKVVRRTRDVVLLALPTTGTWNQGDIVNIRFPVANKTQSYTCTLAGTFGVTDPEFQENGILGAVKGETATDIASLLTSLRGAGIIKT